MNTNPEQIQQVIKLLSSLDHTCTVMLCILAAILGIKLVERLNGK